MCFGQKKSKASDSLTSPETKAQAYNATPSDTPKGKSCAQTTPQNDDEKKQEEEILYTAKNVSECLKPEDEHNAEPPKEKSERKEREEKPQPPAKPEVGVPRKMYAKRRIDELKDIKDPNYKTLAEIQQKSHWESAQIVKK